jgi:carbon storage regulator
MLVLTRKAGQSLVIGDNIVIKILDFKGDNIKIGIEAPKQITVHRQEVFEAIRQENKAAALTSKSIPNLPNLQEPE